MKEYILTKDYNGEIVRIEKDKFKEYSRVQKKIKSLIKEGKSFDEIKEILSKEGK